MWVYPFTILLFVSLLIELIRVVDKDFLPRKFYIYFFLLSVLSVVLRQTTFIDILSLLVILVLFHKDRLKNVIFSAFVLGITISYTLYVDSRGLKELPRPNVQKLMFFYSGKDYNLKNLSEYYLESTYRFIESFFIFRYIYIQIFLAVILILLLIESVYFKFENIKKYKRELLLLGSFIFINVICAGLLSLIGKFPYGSLRYQQGVMVAFSFILVYFFSIYSDQIYKKNLVAFCLIIFSFFSIKDSLVKREKAKDFIKSLNQDCFYVVDYLHSFMFKFYTKRSPEVVNSRGYPCINGKFWNAHGWNDCSDHHKLSKFLIDGKKIEKNLCFVSRGPITKKSYPIEFEYLIKNYSKYSQLLRMEGIYLYRYSGENRI